MGKLGPSVCHPFHDRQTLLAALTWPRPCAPIAEASRPGRQNCGSGASEGADGPSGVAPGVGVQGAPAVDDVRGGGASGEAVRVDVGELRPLGEVQQQVGVLDSGDGVVDSVEVGVRLVGRTRKALGVATPGQWAPR